ncbi:hypothetical protein KUW09_23525 [Mameliella alba]|nr:hypothetical protein [Antarctobacter heliothermus]MBY6147043.1 hypothetical protein [Mameliella alba]MCA0957048.1 hypothetical protein [Mameliella alba]
MDKIPDIEVRQFVRFELERRRALERELSILKNGLKRIPRVRLSDLFEMGESCLQEVQSNEHENFGFGGSQARKIRELLMRIDDLDNLRHLGLKAERGDILALTGALVISAEELVALRALVDQESG